MNFLRKALNFCGKLILGIYIFYLFLSFIIVPLGAPWIISSQATKQLKHTVKVGAVLFNPFLLRFNLNGFKITGQDKQEMVGFNKFWVDFSFIRLLRKELHFESIGLDGLRANVVLLEGGKVNLLDLVPASAIPPKSTPEEKTKIPQTPDAAKPAAKPLPLVTVGKLVLKRTMVSLSDQAIAPGFKTVFSNMESEITGISTKPDAQIKVVFGCLIDGKGTFTTEAVVWPFAQPLKFESVSSLSNYVLTVFTPYVGKYTGHAVKDGRLGINMNYTIADNQLRASHKILVQSFDFGDKYPSQDALKLPFGLALGLLEDGQGRINISLPVTGNINEPKFNYFRLLGQVAGNFFMKMITQPLMFLVSLGGTDPGLQEMGSVRFVVGASELTPENQAWLKALVKGLKERPKILLQVNGSYDPLTDWQAIRKKTFEERYQFLNQESLRKDFRLVQQVYAEFFGYRSYWQLAGKFKDEKGRVKEEELVAEMKRRLIEDAPSNQMALNALAIARAQLVYDFILQEGFDQSRLSLGENRQVQGSMGYVPLEFTVTVFEEPAVQS